MIHITKNKKNEFAVAVVANNGELLSMSEGLSSKQNAKKNIESLCDALHAGAEIIAVQDDTAGTFPILLSYRLTGATKWINHGAERLLEKYIPGKNPKRKAAAKKK